MMLEHLNIHVKIKSKYHCTPIKMAEIQDTATPNSDRLETTQANSIGHNFLMFLIPSSDLYSFSIPFSLLQRLLPN